MSLTETFNFPDGQQQQQKPVRKYSFFLLLFSIFIYFHIFIRVSSNNLSINAFEHPIRCYEKSLGKKKYYIVMM